MTTYYADNEVYICIYFYNKNIRKQFPCEGTDNLWQKGYSDFVPFPFLTNM